MDFSGYSITLVGKWEIDQGFFDIPTPGNYTVDAETPTDFTFSVINSSNCALLQTPPFPLAQHHLHVEMTGAVGFMPTFSNVIVQNSSSHFPLDPLPPLTNSTSTSSSPTRNLGIIVGIPISGVVLLLLSLFLWRKHTSRSLSHKSISVVEPFNYQATGGSNNVEKSREGRALEVREGRVLEVDLNLKGLYFITIVGSKYPNPTLNR